MNSITKKLYLLQNRKFRMEKENQGLNIDGAPHKRISSFPHRNVKKLVLFHRPTATDTIIKITDEGHSQFSDAIV